MKNALAGVGIGIFGPIFIIGLAFMLFSPKLGEWSVRGALENGMDPSLFNQTIKAGTDAYLIAGFVLALVGGIACVVFAYCLLNNIGDRLGLTNKTN